MDEFIFYDDEDDKQAINSNFDINLHITSKSLKHVDKALQDINAMLYEDIIELWKVYGEC
tara:strand:+ start:550 stop:729 length:180 start_codon:yes stop_codon:yes gene_type:complete